MDLVYLVRNGDENEELLYSLRSAQRFFPHFDNIVIVGYKPEWVSDDIIYIPTHQRRINTAWTNARNNLITACKSPLISEDFILMNDDFIATRKIMNWQKSLLKAKNTIREQIVQWEKKNIISGYTNSFPHTLEFIQSVFKKEDPINYELHIPMIINKTKFNKLIEMPEVAEFIDNSYLTLYRTLYGNFYDIPVDEFIEDVKFYNTEPNEITTEWISVFDKWIGNHRKYPRLNSFLYKTFNKKCIYEK